MTWEKLGERDYLLTQTTHRSSGIETSYDHDPKGVEIEPIAVSRGGIFIAVPATIAAFRKEINIPFHVKNSNISGRLNQITARTRNGKYLTRVIVQPNQTDPFAIFERDINYEMEETDNTLPNLKPIDRMLVPSSAQGVFCPTIRTVLESLTQIDTLDLERCLEYMAQNS